MSQLSQPETQVKIAHHTRDVVDAWRLLYHSYRRAGYISENPYRIHTITEALHPNSLVLNAYPNTHYQQTPMTTITAIMDHQACLPLDCVYPRELAQMRANGRTLMEIGLFGCQDEPSSRITLLDLMRYVAYYAYFQRVDDLICGIPPHRANLYTRWLGFQPAGTVKTYGTVSGNPVILMHGDLRIMHAHNSHLRAVNYFVNHPLTSDIFAQRFSFSPSLLTGSPIDNYLRSKGEVPQAWLTHPLAMDSNGLAA